MSIRALVMLVCTLLLAQLLAAETILFEICAESTTWTRPTPEVQAKIWHDLRYKNVADTAYAWTHNFIVIDEPSSASIPYHLMNTSGLWAARPVDRCELDQNGRSGYEWIEVWSLLHRVTHVQHENNTYSVTVEPTGRGFQFVYFRRLNPSVVLRFVTPDGKELETWDESAPPNRDKNEVPPGTRIIRPNGEIIRK